MRTIERARTEIERGRLWRAKEILQGSVRTLGYNPELYEEYGRLLLRMGESPEAGRVLFLSGARKAEYEEPIHLYLGKYGQSPARLFRSFPQRARLVVLATYPKTVENELRERGFPNNLSLFPLSRISRDVKQPSPYKWLGVIVFILFVLVILVLIGLGWIKLRELQEKYPII
jgi:hypothetical protein